MKARVKEVLTSIKTWLSEWLWGILKALTQLLNAILKGHEDEATSSRCWRLRDRAFWKQLRWVVDKLLGENHCKEAYEKERKAVPAWER